MILRAVALIGAGLLTACVTTPPPGAVLAYARSDCAQAPSLAGAVSLTPERETASHVVTAAIDAHTPCLVRASPSPQQAAADVAPPPVDPAAAPADLAGSVVVATNAPPAPETAPYVVFAIPADRGDKTITVGAVAEPLRVFAPEVSVLDAAGQITRRFADDQYLFRGAFYSVQFRPRENESYVLVTADRARVGQVHNSIAIGTNTTTTYAAGVYVSFTTGTDAAQSRSFSYEGAVQVTVSDSDTEEEGG